MKQVLSEFIAAKRAFFNKYTNNIKSGIHNKDAFTQEIFQVLQHTDPSNELEIPAFEYLVNLLVTKNRSKKYEHILGRIHMFMDFAIHELVIKQKVLSQTIREEWEQTINKMSHTLQINFKKLHQLNHAGANIYHAVKEYPPFAQKLILLSYIVSQPNLSEKDRLHNIYGTSTEPTKYQQLIVQLSLEKIVRNTLFEGIYDQLIADLCTNHNVNAKKGITKEMVHEIFQKFIKSYTDPTVIFSQTTQIQQNRINLLQRNQNKYSYTKQEIFFHARLFYCSYMINSELIRESFLVYRDQAQQQHNEQIKVTVKSVDHEPVDEIITSRRTTQEQAIVIEEITQWITNTYGCFQHSTGIYKYLCRVIF